MLTSSTEAVAIIHSESPRVHYPIGSYAMAISTLYEVLVLVGNVTDSIDH